MRKDEVREELLVLAAELEKVAIRLRELKQELHSRSPIRRAKSKSLMSKDEQKRVVLNYLAKHPEAGYQEIATETGVNNIGRVSEALAGFRP